MTIAQCSGPGPEPAADPASVSVNEPTDGREKSITPRTLNADQPRPGLSAGLFRRAKSESTALLWLAATVILGAAAGATVPTAGLDPSWRTAINIAAAEDRRFGRDIIFTYGPWGFLDRPMLVNRQQFVLGNIFAVAAAAAIFLTLYACLKRTCSPRVAAPIAFAVTLATPVVDPGLRLLCAGLGFALLTLLGGSGTASRRWSGVLPAGLLAALAALMLQVKFSEGVAVTGLAGILVVFTPSIRALATNAAVAIAAFTAAFLLTWSAAGQAIGDIVPWLHSSWEIAAGYQKAMATEPPDTLVSYVLVVLLALVAGALALRIAGSRKGAAGFGVVVLVVAMLLFGFKQGFTRHDAGHEVAYFVIAGSLLIGLAPHARRPVAVLTAAALAFALVPRGFEQFDPVIARDRLRASAEATLNSGYQHRLLADARQRARSEHQVSSLMLAEIGERPVSVDPWEASLPWAYSMRWRPVPVFQAYSAYTPQLDEMNARAIVAAPRDQMVLRQMWNTIDGRNTRWETPRYLLALACNYTVVTSDSRWSLLRHGENRCAEPRTIEVHDVKPGQVVETPAVKPNEILVARFIPRSDGLPATLLGTVLKDWWPLAVAADDRQFRLPEGLADGPLLVSFPSALGWAQPFDGFQYKRLSFNEPGRLEFQVLPVA